MEGITGYLFRCLHHRYFPGVDQYFMPFLSPTQGHTFTRREMREIAPEHNQGVPVVPQLLTSKSEDFLWAAGELAAMGYREVNLNLGCPSGTVSAKGKGAGFLAFPEELDHFLSEIFTRSPIPISVKTRLGMKEPEEFVLLLEIYNRYPVQQLIIHTRVREDFYRNPVRPEWFTIAAEQSKNPICYNGDLFTVRQCIDFAQSCPGIEGIMLGRGLIADPALAAKFHGGQAAQPAQLEAFVTELYENYASDFGSRRNAVMRMKEVWHYLLSLFRDGPQYVRRMRKAVRPEEYETVVRDIFLNSPVLDDSNPIW